MIRFITVQDAITNTPMLIRADQINRIWEAEYKGMPVRAITFLNGDNDYVLDSLQSLTDTLINLFGQTTN